MRREAVYALLVLGDRRAIPALLRVLRNPEEPTALRGYASEVLSVLGAGNPRVVAALLERLEDKDREVSFFAASALALCGDQSAVAPLEELLSEKAADPHYAAVADQARYALELIRARSK